MQPRMTVVHASEMLRPEIMRVRNQKLLYSSLLSDNQGFIFAQKRTKKLTSITEWILEFVTRLDYGTYSNIYVRH